MNEFPMPPPNIVIRAPLPHVSIETNDVHSVRAEFGKLGLNISFRAEENYPVSSSWAEIAILAGTFIGSAAANHYAEILFDALDKFLKVKIDHIDLCISKDKKMKYQRIPRKHRADAIAAIKKAIEEIESTDS